MTTAALYGRPSTERKTMAAVAYARFSTEKQNARSIGDQFADCEAFAAREGHAFVGKYHDEAQSASSQHNRPGLAALKRDAKARKFQLIIVEAQDRLWGDQEDMWHLFKRFTHWGVKIHSLTEGVLDQGKLTMGGFFAAERLRNISEKTKRGRRGAASRGLFFSVAYGYRRVMVAPATGDRPAIYDPGKREIDPEKAETVVRIFQEIAAGRSPRLICKGLERDGRISPQGTTKWNFTSLTGGRSVCGQGTCGGIIGNELYKGVMVSNQTYREKDPDTNAIKKRTRPESEWVRVPVPHLLIVPADLWERANQAVKARSRGGALRGAGNVVPRTDHALSGMFRCAVCGGKMRIASLTRGARTRIGCATAGASSACEHRKSYDLATLQSLIKNGMRDNLLNPEALMEFAKAYHARRAENDKRNRSEAAHINKRHARVLIDLERAADAFIATGAPVLKERIARLEAERKQLESRRQMIEAESNVLTLHPAALAAHKAALLRLIDGDLTKPAERAAFRLFWDHFVVHPTPNRAPYQITPVARLGALMGGVDLFPKNRPIEEIVQDQGIRLSDNAYPTNHATTKHAAATASAATPCLMCTRAEPASNPGTKPGSEPAGTSQ
jgi:site-specific DNA recombinase